VRATIRKSTRIYRVSALFEPDSTVPEAIKAIPHGAFRTPRS
jgi:hypothetical protein